LLTNQEEEDGDGDEGDGEDEEDEEEEEEEEEKEEEEKEEEEEEEEEEDSTTCGSDGTAGSNTNLVNAMKNLDFINPADDSTTVAVVHPQTQLLTASDNPPRRHSSFVGGGGGTPTPPPKSKLHPTLGQIRASMASQSSHSLLDYSPKLTTKRRASPRSHLPHRPKISNEYSNNSTSSSISSTSWCLLSIIYRYRNADNRTNFPVSLSIIFGLITINFDKFLP
jgi:hypothetical protein